MAWVLFCTVWCFGWRYGTVLGYWSAVWWNKWALVLLGGIFYLATFKPRSFPTSAWVYLLLSIVSAFYGLVHRGDWYLLDFNDAQHAELRVSATYAILALVIPTAFFSLAKPAHLKGLRQGLAVAAIIESVLILLLTAVGYPPDSRGAVLGNDSMAGCFVALCFPLCVHLILDIEHEEGSPYIDGALGILCLIAPIAAIVALRCSVPLAVFGVVMLGMLRDVRARWMLLLVPVVGGLTVLAQGVAEFFTDSGRLHFWHDSLMFWYGRENFPLLTGSGVGSVQSVFPVMQLRFTSYANTNSVGIWFFAHNDWLQIFLEQGLVGLTAALVLGYTVLRNAWSRDSWLFAMAAGLGVCMLANFPWHMPMTAVVGGYILAAALRPEEDIL